MSNQQQPQVHWAHGLNMSNEPESKGRLVYCETLSKQVFIDGFNRIIDPSFAPVRNIPVQQNISKPEPVQRSQPQLPRPQPVQPCAQGGNVSRPQPARREPVFSQEWSTPKTHSVSAPNPVPRSAAQNVPMHVASNQVVQRPSTPMTNQRQPTRSRPVTPAQSFAQRMSATNTQTRPAAASQNVRQRMSSASRNTPRSRRTRSASVSSSGSTRSNISRKSNTTRKNKESTRYRQYYLNRKAVLRRGPSLNTRVIANLDANVEITVDESTVVTIMYNDDLRRRIKVIAPKQGWVTVATERGKLYRRSRRSFQTNL